jgi:hypothetical protein
MRVLLNLVVAFSFFFLVISQNTDDSSATNDTVLDPKWSYCFEFTWFGPQYEKGNMYNGTCADYLDSSRATNVPCSAPVVISGEYLSNYRNCNISHHSETQRTVLRLILIGCSKIRGPMCCAEEPKTKFVQLTLTNTLA